MDEKIDRKEESVKEFIKALTTYSDIESKFKDNDRISSVGDFVEFMTPAIRRLLKSRAMVKKKNEVFDEYRQGYSPDEEDREALEAGRNELIIPEFTFNDISCLDMDFFERVDKMTGMRPTEEYLKTVKTVKDFLREKIDEYKGEQGSGYQRLKALFDDGDSEGKYFIAEKPDFIIISTGDDFRNIQLANALMADICNETRGEKKDDMLQTIIVYIRDKRNNKMLFNANGVWKDNFLSLPYVNVIVAGNTDRLYTYDSIVNHEEAAKYIFGYNCFGDAAYEIGKDHGETLKQGHPEKGFFTDWIDYSCRLMHLLSNADKKSRDEMAELEKKAPDSIKKYLETIYAKDRIKDWERISEAEWMKESPYAKESNRSAQMYGKVMNYVFGKNDGDVVDLCTKLTLWEHVRWKRYHIINGWSVTPKTGKSKDELLLRHNCLVPYAMVQNQYIFYDVTNVLWAINESYVKKQGK